MANISATNIDNTQVFIKVDPGFTEDTFVEAGAGEVYPAGTALGRVTASSKLAPYDSGAADGSETIVTVLASDLDTTAGAGDYVIRRVNSAVARADLVIENGVGAITNKAVLDTLNANGIAVVDTTETSFYDNAV